MKTLIRKSLIQVIGPIWQPAVIGTYCYPLSSYDVENAKDSEGRLTRDSVKLWLGSHAGDFKSITDFHASLEDGNETVDIPWKDEESECAYLNSMYPQEA